MGNVLLASRFLVILSVVFLSQNFYPFVPRIVFIDVGQGDATLIMPEPDFQILIDGGPGDFVLEGLGRYMPFWDRKIELVILTHPHLDHMEGLLDVFERYEVGTAIYNPVCYPSRVYGIFKKSLGFAKEALVAGKHGAVGSGDGWVLNIIYPHQVSERECYAVSNINNGSVVSLFQYKDLKVLITGDAEEEEEAEMLKERVLEDIDVLKAGHHCSRTSSSEEFLDVVKPEVAICSAGENNLYGHPHIETLEKFRQRGIKFHVTSESGDIVINLSSMLIYNEE